MRVCVLISNNELTISAVQCDDKEIITRYENKEHPIAATLQNLAKDKWDHYQTVALYGGGIMMFLKKVPEVSFL